MIKRGIAFLIVIMACVNVCYSQDIYDGTVSATSSQNDEGEAHIAINFSDSNQMVLGFMETGNTALNFQIYHSDDKGGSWKKSEFDTKDAVATDFPGYEVIGGGDVVFAYDKTGKLYCTWIYLLSNPTLSTPFDSCIWASYWAESTNNGKNFTLSNGQERLWGYGKLQLSAAGGVQSIYNVADGVCDRQWLAVDYSNGVNENKLYVGYLNYPSNLQQTGLRIKSKAQNQTSFSSASNAYSGNGHLTSIIVDDNGTLHYVFANIASNDLYHVSSTDGGQTFSAPHLIANGDRLMPQSNHLVNNRENAAPSFAIDGAGNLHVVWNDFPSGNTFPTAYYAKSTDRGLNWDAPESLETIFNGNVFMPVVSAIKNRVTIGANVLDNDKKSSYFIATSMDNGDTYTESVKMSSGLTDYGLAGFKQKFVGDYSSAVRTECEVYSLWTDCRSGDCRQYVAKYNECIATGVVELSPIKSGFSDLSIFPVPANNFLTVLVENEHSDDLIAEIISLEGKQMLKKQIHVEEGKNRFELDLDKLTSGQYILKITNEEGVFQTKAFTKL